MKPIEQMNLAELADDIDAFVERFPYFGRITNRLRKLHDLTRWIPVDERMPTEEDVMKTDDDTHSYMNGLVLWYVEDKTGSRYYHFSKWYLPPKSYYKLISWKRIIPPEDK